MVGIVIVAHSGELADAVKRLVEHLVQGEVSVAAAGGVDDPDHPFGTNAPAIQRAIDSVYSDDGVVVLMDMGSSLLSAEMSLDFISKEKRHKIRLCEASLVEGAVSAGVCASGGGSLKQVLEEARRALSAKQAHLGSGVAQSQGGEAPRAIPRETMPCTGEHARDFPSQEKASRARQHEITLTVENPLGIHARPAARFVRTAARFQSEITIRNLAKKSGAVSAKSINLVATLDVEKGDAVAISARGPDAGEALDALRELVEANFGDPPAHVTVELLKPGQETRPEPGIKHDQASTDALLTGIPGSPGAAVGPGFFFKHPVSKAVSGIPEHVTADPGAEWGRLERALATARQELRALRVRVSLKVGEYNGSIYDAHMLTLDDPAVKARARASIYEGLLKAEKAWDLAMAWMIEKYEGASSQLLRTRGADLTDLRDRVIGVLTGRILLDLQISEPSILLAPDITPSDIALLDTDKVLGVCTAAGGAASHAVILARAVGLPMVVGLGPQIMQVPEGTMLAMDGSLGQVAWNPGKIREFEKRRRSWKREQSRLEKTGKRPATTRDGHRIEVCANISSLAELRRALRVGAEGVGVLRTEFLFVKRPTAPSENEQYRVYASMAELLEDRPFTVRTLDAGGDKSIPYLSLKEEANPFLGIRGIRLSLNKPGLFSDQLRAILRASAGRSVKILLPMVSSLEEVRSARELVDNAKSELSARGVPFDERVELGIMIEVPSAAMIAEQLSREVGFFSIGTNDLCQYVMAADRTNPEVASLNDALHPALLRAVDRCVNAGHGAGIKVSVCGEMAHDRSAIPILLGLGVDGLSMSPSTIPDTKAIIRELTMKDTARIAREALDMDSAQAVRTAVDRFYRTR